MSDKLGHLKKLTPEKAKMVKLLEKHLTNVTAACLEMGMSRNTHYTWMNDDAAYAEAVNELKNVELDFYEDALRSRIKEGSDAAIIFALKTKGRSRGWQEKSEMKVEHNYSNLTDEELAALVDQKRKELE